MSKEGSKSSKLSVGFGLAFVWFTTQFGGGFASGAQLKTYFLGYGIYCLITCVGAQIICGIYNGFISYFARKHETYDYSSFNKALYGKLSPIFCILFEILYIVTMMVAPTVAFATGGETMSNLTGIPYLLCTLIIGAFIFVVAIYGTDIVRRVATILSILIVVGLLVVYIPNIIVQAGSISANVGDMAANMPSIWPALWSMFLYASFQIASSPAIHSQHAVALEEPKDAVLSYGLGILVNGVMIFLATIALLAIVGTEEYATSSLPVMLLISNGVGGITLTAILSILIILGSVSTAVNMISAGAVRFAGIFDKNFDPNAKPGKTLILITLILCIIDFCIAQFGLLTLIQKGYGLLSYLTIPVIMIPYIVIVVYKKLIKKEEL